MSKKSNEKNFYNFIGDERESNKKAMISRLRPYIERSRLLDLEILIQFAKDFNFDLQMHLNDKIIWETAREGF